MGYSAIRSKGETQDVNKGRDVSGICLTSKTGDILCHVWEERTYNSKNSPWERNYSILCM